MSAEPAAASVSRKRAASPLVPDDTAAAAKKAKAGSELDDFVTIRQTGTAWSCRVLRKHTQPRQGRNGRA